jgi:glycine/D-amino acid oxidase-like deaminating enzyme
VSRPANLWEESAVIAPPTPGLKEGSRADGAHLKREVAQLFPRLKGVRFTHRSGGRVAIHPDYMPRLHAPEPGLFVAIGC